MNGIWNPFLIPVVICLTAVPACGNAEARPATLDERAKRAALEHFSSELQKLHRLGEGRYLGFDEKVAYEFHVNGPLEELEWSLVPANPQMYFAHTDNVTVRVKPLETRNRFGFQHATNWLGGLEDQDRGPDRWRVRLPGDTEPASINADSFPLLIPWSANQKLDSRAIVVSFEENGRISVSSDYSQLVAPDPEDVAKLYGNSQRPFLSDATRTVFEQAQVVFETVIRPHNGRFFTCQASLIPLARNAVHARFPNEVFEWPATHGEQNTLLTIQEFAGKAQCWIVEQELKQHDEINGLVAKGRVVMALRGFSRDAAVEATTRKHRRDEEVRLAPRPREDDAPTYWSAWTTPVVKILRYEYSVSTDGSVSVVYEADIYGRNVDPALEGLKQEHLNKLLELTEYTHREIPEEKAVDY